MTGRSIRT